MVKLGTLTQLDVIDNLRDKQGELSLRQFAVKVGCSAAYLSDLYRLRREPAGKVLKFLGMRRERVVLNSYFWDDGKKKKK